MFVHFVVCLESTHRLHPFFFNDTATTEIYTLSLHDALPISVDVGVGVEVLDDRLAAEPREQRGKRFDRASTGSSLLVGERWGSGERERSISGHREPPSVPA